MFTHVIISKHRIGVNPFLITILQFHHNNHSLPITNSITTSTVQVITRETDSHVPNIEYDKQYALHFTIYSFFMNLYQSMTILSSLKCPPTLTSIPLPIIPSSIHVYFPLSHPSNRPLGFDNGEIILQPWLYPLVLTRGPWCVTWPNEAVTWLGLG